ncbi:MAG TPA: N-6 DNA methylase, partial [Gemmatimonadaceae bacterium]|nr:N-6 DNA methylase [Gemmatimonadaceae bacterium]
LLADRARLVDSDAETVRALAAAAGPYDVLTHARWVEVLGRDALTGRFYRALERALDAMAASSRAGSDGVRRELALLDISRLLFLGFLEAKGWLNGDRGFLAHQFERCLAHDGRFRDRVLRTLFFGTLNTPADRRAATARRFGAVPFLNGGLFARAPLERRWKKVTFSDESYGTLLFDVFGQFRFTAREETTSWSEAAIDPEMLGKSFECLMAHRDRRTTGAFFTPLSLVERVARGALDSIDLASLDVISRISVLDPACGSGAFLVHVLERLADRARILGDERPPSVVRRGILTRSIFGVDVNPTAVWLCQLRLWLSVVIDSDEANPAAVMPLPNLDRNIRVGDTLSGPATGTTNGLARGAPGMTRLRERYARATGPRKESLARELDRAERARAGALIGAQLETIAAKRRDLVIARRGRDLFGEPYRAGPGERSAALALRRAAAALRTQRRSIDAGGALPFSFPTHFGDIGARGGFTAIVGNPPWVRLHRIPANQREAFRRDYVVAQRAAWQAGAELAGSGLAFAAQVDLASLFVERCAAVLSAAGTMALLVPSKLWRSLAGGGVRQLLRDEMDVLRLEDYSEAAAVFDAAVYPSLLVARRRRPQAFPDVRIVVHHRGRDALEWRTPPEALVFDDSPGAPWLFLPPEPRCAFELLRRLGRPLAGSVFGRPHLGVKCGCNDAFLVEALDVRGDVAEVVTAAGTTIVVEARLLRPLIRGEALRRWHVSPNHDSILWTHDESGSALAALPPLAARWFSRWRHALIGRTDARHRARWWSLFRVEAAQCQRPRVVWADVGKEMRASVLPAGDSRVPLNTCYVVRCRDDADAHALTALLNGPVARAWLNTIAEPARGGYHRYLGWTLSLLPLPTAWDSAREPLADIGRRGALGAAVGDAELLEASATAYGVAPDEVEALVTWNCR